MNIQLTYVVGCPKPNASSYCTIHRLYFWLELVMELSAQYPAWQKQLEKSSKAMKKFLDIQIFFWHWIVYLNISHLEYYHIKSPSKYGPKWVILNSISVQLYVLPKKRYSPTFFFSLFNLDFSVKPRLHHYPSSFGWKGANHINNKNTWQIPGKMAPFMFSHHEWSRWREPMKGIKVDQQTI